MTYAEAQAIINARQEKKDRLREIDSAIETLEYERDDIDMELANDDEYQEALLSVDEETLALEQIKKNTELAQQDGLFKVSPRLLKELQEAETTLAARGKKG